MEGMIGEIRMFGGNFAPKNWAFCMGQIVAIASNTALFSILGTTYGGNGTTTFAYPNLAGRIPIGAGQGPGLTNVVLGEVAGTDSVTLTTSTMPMHTHTAIGNVAPGAANGKITLTGTPTGNYPGATDPTIAMYTASTNATMAPSTVNTQIGFSGNNSPFSIVKPVLGMNYILCIYGIYPSRN